MKKNFTLNALFVLTMILSVTFTQIVSAQTERNTASNKTTAALYAPVVSANVVINEVYGGSELSGNVYNADFIELYNPSDSAVNISDYSVQYYTAGQINGGAPTSTAHIPDGTMLQPLSFYVIRVSPIRSTGEALSCAALDDSASFAETGIAADGGKFVLTTTGADLSNCMSALNVLDRLGFGTEPAEPCHESFNANQPSTATSVQRWADRADTDNNSTDFTSFAAPTPCRQLLAPTAAEVNVGGRVTDSKNRGISKVQVLLTDSEGKNRVAYTNTTGYYSFNDVEVGQTVIFEARAKVFNFVQPTQVVFLTEEASNINFRAYFSGKR